MPLLSHELEQEFPHLKETIHRLRSSDTHFARVCEEYKSLDAEVSRIEETEAPVSDFDLEDMKKKRLRLKDEIYSFLRAYPR
jgi:hypothetical protein